MRQTALDGRRITGTVAKARNYTADGVPGTNWPGLMHVVMPAAPEPSAVLEMAMRQLLLQQTNQEN